MFDLTGKKALVTGAARGIGQAIAERLAEAGATVGIADMREADFSETVAIVEKYSPKCYVYKMDITNTQERKASIDEAIGELGGIDILVNNAGINIPTAALDMTEEIWDKHYDINVKAGFFIAQQVAPQMMERGWGRIIFTASQAGFVAIANQPAYNTSKAAIIHIVRCLGLDWAKYGITVNGIAPTFIKTKLSAVRLENEEFKNKVLSMIPCGKLGEADDVGYAAVYLASNEAKMVNCHTLKVDGGWTAH